MSEHVIQRLPVDTGRSGWEAISTRRTDMQSLAGDIHADWLIIGGGFAGLSAARRLSQLRPGEKIVVVEAKEIATGPAGRNSGFMIDVPHSLSSGEYSVAGAEATAFEIAQNRLAIAFARSAAQEYGMSARTFNPSGKINASATARGVNMNANYARSLGGIGEKFERFDAQQMKEITGSAYYLDGLYTPGAVMIQPAQYIRDLAAGLAGKIELYEHSPVMKLSRVGAHWRATTPHGAVTANKVILGVNGHIEDFGHFKGRLMHIFTYASMTKGFDDHTFGRPVAGHAHWALLPADPMGATLRKITTDQGDSRIVIRTRFTYDPSIKVPAERVAKIAAEQRASLDARYPALKSLPFENSWAGRLCLSLNSVPAFGEIEENLYSACCENGLGTVKSTLEGIMTAELATQTASDALHKYRGQANPKRIPPNPLAWMGINSVIRWQEYRAGKEG